MGDFIVFGERENTFELYFYTERKHAFRQIANYGFASLPEYKVYLYTSHAYQKEGDFVLYSHLTYCAIYFFVKCPIFHTNVLKLNI